eukprot:CAMPEP_0119260850 /NCGR_PEP_ID=MMETSP1329-20130426/1095_1 /TAXON_ID=114041 /ORGANISM="Genus nov. species nov., Strain RCC1024" /LENGTH=289 /DNA_ID=CAMNT_0007260319 /DNA_START=114 /DNA_END=980 /DNA_ORIENTATION=-
MSRCLLSITACALITAALRRPKASLPRRASSSAVTTTAPEAALPRRTFFSSAAAVLTPAAAHASFLPGNILPAPTVDENIEYAKAPRPTKALGPPLLSGAVRKVELSDEEFVKLLGKMGIDEFDVTYAPNNATLRLAENEIYEMKRRGLLVEVGDAKRLELRTFTPKNFFPEEPGEGWWAPPFHQLSFEFKETNEARREKCFAVSARLGDRVAAKVARVANDAPPEGYEPPKPYDPSICGVELDAGGNVVGPGFKCDTIARPGSYIQEANKRRMAEYEKNKKPAAPVAV